MNKSKLKKYVGKKVKVYFRHTRRSDIGIVKYTPNEPICDYLLYQPQYSGGATFYYRALNPKMIGHIEIER